WRPKLCHFRAASAGPGALAVCYRTGEMRPMLPTLPKTIRVWRALPTDVAIVAALVGLNVAARLLPHAPDFTPVAASALFAASVLRVRALSIVVPLAGMILADAWLGFYDPRIMAAV